jgi:serine/threonine-protein kinase
VQTDGPASFTVDGHTQSPAADGTLHLAPGRHKVVVASDRLATARSFDLDVKSGEELTRAARSGRGRLKLAVTPWAEVQLDGRSVGTTPLSAIELGEGVHQVTLRNVQLGALVKKRVVVHPDKETALRVDLFSPR